MLATEANEKVWGLSRLIILPKPHNSSVDGIVVMVQKPI